MFLCKSKAEKRIEEIRRQAEKVIVLGREPHRDTYIIGAASIRQLYAAIFAENK